LLTIEKISIKDQGYQDCAKSGADRPVRFGMVVHMDRQVVGFKHYDTITLWCDNHIMIQH